MAKAKAREYVWWQCDACSALNYRTEVRVQGGMPKLRHKKYCPRERTHTEHKLRRK